MIKEEPTRLEGLLPADWRQALVNELRQSSFRNLDKVAFSLHGSLAAYDVLVADHVVFTSAALDRFESARGGETP